MYAFEVNAAHVDGMCRTLETSFSEGYNNMYFMRNYSTLRYSFIPWGLDQTMSVPTKALLNALRPLKDATCGYMRRCFNNRACSDAFDDFYASVPAGTFHHNHFWLLATGCVLGIVGAVIGAVIGAVYLARKSIPYSSVPNQTIM